MSQVKEISKNTMSRYLKKTPASSADAGNKMAGQSMNQKDSMKKGAKKLMKRNKGVSMAVDKMTGKAKVPATESFVIPEEIPANERTAFHGAAAAAAKAGKKSFSFAGKTHPVTMKKDTATKIADQKEGTDEAKRTVHSDKEDRLVTMKIKNPKKKSGETATMNPKLGNQKGKGAEMEQKESTIQEVSSGPAQHSLADKGEMKSHAAYMQKTHGVKTKYHGGEKGDELSYHGPKKNVRSALGNHYGDHSDAKSFHPHIYKESTIRDKLIAVLEGERAAHYKGATEAEPMDNNLKGAGAKKMKADMEKGMKPDDTLKKAFDNVSKAGDITKPAKKRAGDNDKGDKKMPTPDDITKKAGMKEQLAGITAAYEKMYKES